jgi:ABC-type uncharacterized transport system fused permease/ATPase subunit
MQAETRCLFPSTCPLGPLPLRHWLDQHVLPAFASRILAVDAAVARRCAALHVPDPRSQTDALIAATARVHGVTGVTGNVADFQHCSVTLLNSLGQPAERRARPVFERAPPVDRP